MSRISCKCPRHMTTLSIGAVGQKQLLAKDCLVAFQQALRPLQLYSCSVLLWTIRRDREPRQLPYLSIDCGDPCLSSRSSPVTALYMRRNSSRSMSANGLHSWTVANAERKPLVSFAHHNKERKLPDICCRVALCKPPKFSSPRLLTL